MTTAAKIVRNPGEGHGLTSGLTDSHFDALVKGQPTGLIPALVLLKPHGYGGKETAQGAHRHVEYELARVEPFMEAGDRDDAFWKLQSMYEGRTSTGTQRVLPINLPGEERRQALMERLEEWADENDVTGAQLEQRFRDHFGVGDDPEANLYGIPGDYRKASVAHLLEFALASGAVPDPESGAVATDDGDEPEPDDE